MVGQAGVNIPRGDRRVEAVCATPLSFPMENSKSPLKRLPVTVLSIVFHYPD